MHLRTVPGCLALLVGLIGANAVAGGVYLNDVNIGTAQLEAIAGTALKFDKAKVRIDEKGNLYIEVQGYAIKVEGAAAAPAQPATPEPLVEAPAQLTRRYFLVTEQSVLGMTEYDIDVYINSKWVRKLKNDEEQIVTEITRHLQPGKNTVMFTSHKVVKGERRSLSPSHEFKVIVGEGNVGGDNVMIDNPVVTYKRSAADPADHSQEFTLVTR